MSGTGVNEDKVSGNEVGAEVRERFGECVKAKWNEEGKWYRKSYRGKEEYGGGGCRMRMVKVEGRD